MILQGTLVNIVTVLIGGVLGCIFGRFIPEKSGDLLQKGLGLCVLFIGIEGAMTGASILPVIFAIALGALVGEGLKLEQRLESLGDKLQAKMSKPRRVESATLFDGKATADSALSDLTYMGKSASSAPESGRPFPAEKCEAVSTEQIDVEPSSGREGHIDILPSDTAEVQREFARPNRRVFDSSWLKGGSVSEAFVSASLLFCVGAMSIVGSIESGLGNSTTIYTKALLDGFMAMVFASRLGVGVLFSCFVILFYQGAFELLAGVVSPFMTDPLTALISCVGNILIMGIGINLVFGKKVSVMNLVPAIFLAVPLYYLFELM
ncbi:MAG: DUF554 domain-containing protein [Clostridia bacterium]|nr:DUF554 domain-containing protein [Clostridia bacterium]